jgi:hypothetical protein
MIYFLIKGMENFLANNKEGLLSDTKIFAGLEDLLAAMPHTTIGCCDVYVDGKYEIQYLNVTASILIFNTEAGRCLELMRYSIYDPVLYSFIYKMECGYHATNCEGVKVRDAKYDII